MDYSRPFADSRFTECVDGDGAAGGLIAGDWGGPAPAAPVRKAPTPGAPSLHLRSRPGDVARELARAREVVDQARQLIEESFARVRRGERIDGARFTAITDGVLASIHRSPSAILNVLHLKQMHEYTYLHSVAVCALMIGLARELKLDRGTTRELGLAGLLHDIGKARICNTLLDKPSSLSADEWATMKQHSILGHQMLTEVGGLPQIALDVCLHHHERIDGTGYPYGLSGDALSLPVRMSMICDVYDAVTTQRSYKAKWTPARAIEWMRGRPDHFDAGMMQRFTRLFGTFPPGTLVRLRSDRLAMVHDGPGTDPLSPPVVAFQCALSGQSLPWRLLSSREDPIVSIECPVKWRINEWTAISTRLMAVTPVAPIA